MGCGLCGLVLFCARSSDLGAESIFDRTKPIFDRACGINGLQALGPGLAAGWCNVIAEDDNSLIVRAKYGWPERWRAVGMRIAELDEGGFRRESFLTEQSQFPIRHLESIRLRPLAVGSGGGCWGWSRRGVSERRRLVLCVIHLLNASGSRGGAVQGGGIREIGSVLPTSRIALGWAAAGG